MSIRYWLEFIEVERAEAKLAWEAHCAREGLSPFEIAIFDQAEKLEEGEAERSILKENAKIIVVVK